MGSRDKIPSTNPETRPCCWTFTAPPNAGSFVHTCQEYRHLNMQWRTSSMQFGRSLARTWKRLSMMQTTCQTARMPQSRQMHTILMRQHQRKATAGTQVLISQFLLSMSQLAVAYVASSSPEYDSCAALVPFDPALAALHTYLGGKQSMS